MSDECIALVLIIVLIVAFVGAAYCSITEEQRRDAQIIEENSRCRELCGNERVLYCFRRGSSSPELEGAAVCAGKGLVQQ